MFERDKQIEVVLEVADKIAYYFYCRRIFKVTMALHIAND
jgi:hypothetical protein